MVNSSPEYSITKPGLNPLRKRDKPLRTYGRRTSSTPEARGEPTSKKPRLAAVESQRESASLTHEHSGDSKPTVSTEHQPKQDTAAPAMKETGSSKGSILSYFKPAPPKPKATDSCQGTASLSTGSTSPSSSVAGLHAKRKPRLLRVRAVLPLNYAEEISGHEERNDGVGLAQDGEGSEEDSSGGVEGDKELDSRDPSAQDTDDLNQRRTRGGANETKRNGSTKSKLSSGVQTTLNISAQAAFSECKVCDTVWNPLYPDDVKYHTKRHKAVLRAQKKKLDDL